MYSSVAPSKVDASRDGGRTSISFIYVYVIRVELEEFARKGVRGVSFILSNFRIE